MRRVSLSLILICVLTTSLVKASLPWSDFSYIEKSLPRFIQTLSAEQLYLNQVMDIGTLVETAASTPELPIPWLDQSQVQIAEDRNALNQTTQILSDIQKAGRFLTTLDGQSLLQVPFGIKGTFGDFEYLIGFDNIKLLPEHAELDIVAGLYFPLLGDTLYFALAGVKYNNSSGFLGDVKLQLIQDFPIEFNQGTSALVFRGYRPELDQGTYINVDCDGVQGLQLGLSVVFNPEVIRPVDPAQKFVQSYGQFSLAKNQGFSIQNLTVPPFYFREFEDFAFELRGLSLDMDETSTAISHIADYQTKLVSATGLALSPPQWTGFYCEHFSVLIGNKYFRSANGRPVTIKGEHIVIDELGFTAQLSIQGAELLSYHGGSIGGWQMSIDALELDILASQFRNFGFGGMIQVPILAKANEDLHQIPLPDEQSSPLSPSAESALRYAASINQDDQSLELNVEVTGEEELSIPMLFANVQLSEGSHISVRTGDDLDITAYLNGNLAMRGSLAGGSELKGPQVAFQGLMISNQAPYFGVENFYPLSADNEGNLGRFSLTFDSLEVIDFKPEEYRSQVKRLSIHNLSIAIGNTSDGDRFRIESSLHAFFGVSPDRHGHKWTGRGIQFEKFAFETTLPGIEKIAGEMQFFYGDPTYGEAFAGSGFVEFEFIEATVDMTCMFGSTGENGFDFSYVDAALSFPSPKSDHTETAAAFQVLTLMAGYHKNMIRRDLTSFDLDSTPGSAGLSLGGKQSQNPFLPELASSGIKGGMVVKFGKAAIAGVRLEYEKYPSEGQGFSSRFYLEGLVELMAKEDQSAVSTKRVTQTGEVPDDSKLTQVEMEDFAGSGSFGGYIRIHLVKTPQERLFEAAMGIHGVAAGIAIAFYGEYFKDNTAWHLFVGKPSNRLKIAYQVNWTDVAQATLGLSGYFMIGNSPDMPKEPPPPYAMGIGNEAMLGKAYDLLREEASSNIYMQQSSSLSQGRALALGASFGINASIDLFPISVDAGADIGFDVLMNQNTPECSLTAIETTGINGWYLQGQMYAGISARVGIAIGKPGKAKSFKIFEGGVAAVLQGAGFNPTWGIGSWVITFQILFIKGTAHGIFRFGEPCEEIIQPQIATDIIENINPTSQVSSSEDESTTIGIGSDFLIDFSLPGNRSVIETMINFADGSSTEIELSLKPNAYLTGEDGSVITTDIFFLRDGHTLMLRPKKMLTPNTEVQVYVKAEIFDRTGPYRIDGESFNVDTIVQYRVDPNGLLSLTNNDVVSSYPMTDQQFFHPEEFQEMAINYGKEIDDQNIEITGILYEETSDGLVEIERKLAILSHGRITQRKFEKLKTGKRYLWNVLAKTSAGNEGSICEIPFASSKFPSFKDKIQGLTLSVRDPGFPVSSDTIRLDVISSEPLEYFSGSFLAIFAAKNQANQTDKTTGPKPTKVDNPFEKGHQYFTRIEAPFIPTGNYSFLRELQNNFLPYGQTIRLECQIDDLPEAQSNADPRDKFIDVEVFTKDEVQLQIVNGLINYHLLSTVKDDYLDYQQLQPGPPAYYAGCESLYNGEIPNYQVGNYPVIFKYFIPVFNTYSQSRKIIDFQIED